jgi:hypothetical protein
MTSSKFSFATRGADFNSSFSPSPLSFAVHSSNDRGIEPETDRFARERQGIGTGVTDTERRSRRSDNFEIEPVLKPLRLKAQKSQTWEVRTASILITRPTDYSNPAGVQRRLLPTSNSSSSVDSTPTPPPYDPREVDAYRPPQAVGKQDPVGLGIGVGASDLPTQNWRPPVQYPPPQYTAPLAQFGRQSAAPLPVAVHYAESYRPYDPTMSRMTAPIPPVLQHLPLQPTPQSQTPHNLQPGMPHQALHAEAPEPHYQHRKLRKEGTEGHIGIPQNPMAAHPMEPHTGNKLTKHNAQRPRSNSFQLHANGVHPYPNPTLKPRGTSPTGEPRGRSTSVQPLRTRNSASGMRIVPASAAEPRPGSNNSNDSQSPTRGERDGRKPRRSWLPGGRSRSSSQDIAERKNHPAWVLSQDNAGEYKTHLLARAEKVYITGVPSRKLFANSRNRSLSFGTRMATSTSICIPAEVAAGRLSRFRSLLRAHRSSFRN